MSATRTSLTGVKIFQPGVGGQDDLFVQARAHLDTGWYARVRPGYYYLGTEENYWFASGASTTASLSTGSVQTVTISGIDYDATLYGPIRVTKSGNRTSLCRVISPLRCFRPMSFATSGSLKLATTSGTLVNLCCDAVSGQYYCVGTTSGATGAIVDLQDYTYCPNSGTVWIRDASPPSLFGTFVDIETSTDRFRLEEIVRVDLDGYVRTQYGPVVSGTALKPVITKPRRAGILSVTGTVVSGNVISLPAGSGIVSGDIVAVQYYAYDTFAAVMSGTNLVITAMPSTTGSYTIEWDTGAYWYDTAELSSGATNRIQLNPMLEPRESGFFYLIDSVDPWPVPKYLQIRASTYNPLYDASGSARTILTVLVLDQNLQPLPQQTLSVGSSGAAGTLTRLYPTGSAVTDGMGYCLYGFIPTATGTLVVSGSVVGYGAVSGVLSLPVRNISQYETNLEQKLGKLLIHMEAKPTRLDMYRLSARYVYPDGYSVQPDATSGTWQHGITFTSSLGALHREDGSAVGTSVSIPITGPLPIATILSKRIPGDVLRASLITTDTGSAERMRWSDSIEVQGEPDELTTEEGDLL